MDRSFIHPLPCCSKSVVVAQQPQKSITMRIGCLQFAPQVGDVDNNLNRADSVLNRADPRDLDDLDLLVLPEMAFSGAKSCPLSPCAALHNLKLFRS